ncbi:MAG TPA: hypothetical protein VGM88_11755 [Kofleriaceae bacterium]|jgi:hypothetical protein
MKRLAFTLLLAAACGGSAPATSTTPPADNGPVVGPPQVAWKDMNKEQMAKFMDAVVVPKFKPIFQQFDPKGFAEFGCKTCHGEAAVKDKTFKMPNPDIFVLPEAEADFGKIMEKKPDWMKFMGGVEEEMAKTLNLPPFDPKSENHEGQFGCYGCHTHKPGGGELN